MAEEKAESAKHEEVVEELLKAPADNIVVEFDGDQAKL